MTPLDVANGEIARLRRLLEDAKDEASALRRQLSIEADEGVVEALKNWVGLTAQEARLVGILYKARGRTVAKAAINDAIPNVQDRGRDRHEKIIDVWLARVRDKIGFAAIRTVWGGQLAITDVGVAQVERALSGEPMARAFPGCGPLLDAATAREIAAQKGVFSGTTLATRYGCKPALIYDIWAGRGWGGAVAALPEGEVLP